VLIPATILWASTDTPYTWTLANPGQIIFWAALLAGSVGLALRVWTDSLFVRFGDGTLAPWNPPKNLVVRGPCRHVRNLVITSVVIIMFAESMFFQSWPLAVWPLTFFVVHLVYFPLTEERGLKRRFGEEYRAYQTNVPRWIPQLRAWPGPQHHERIRPLHS